MGYDAHITRAEFWPDSPETPITRAEWQATVASDPELTWFPALGPSHVRWDGPSTLQDPWLAWEEGRVHTKNPDAALLAKCCRLAAALGAHVQGDDGEVYELGPDGVAQEVSGAGDTSGGPRAQSPAPWWRWLFG